MIIRGTWQGFPVYDRLDLVIGVFMSIRLILIEDDARYRRSLDQLFRSARGFELLESFSSPLPVLERVEELRLRGLAAPWNLVLTDLEMPHMGGVEATSRLKAALPQVKVVVLTVFEDPATILQAICAGADGYLLKSTRVPELLSGLRSVCEGGAPLTPQVARSLLDLIRKERPSLPASGEPSRLALSEREQQVLRALVEGLSYQQVADILGIALGTVRSHVTAIYAKLRVHSVAAAVNRAIRERLV